VPENNKNKTFKKLKANLNNIAFYSLDGNHFLIITDDQGFLHSFDITEIIVAIQKITK